MKMHEIMKNVYMDNGATTKVLKEVVKEMLPYFEKGFGNASSLHYLGLEAEETLDASREKIADCINAKSEEIIFTSGGTEADNFAVFGAAYFLKDKGNHIITTKIEHSAINKPLKRLEKEGFKVSYLDVDKEGFIDLDQLKKEITAKTILVTIIHANNEMGTIQDLEKIGAICKEKKVLFHTDACQSFTKTEIDVKKQNIDLMSINSHKIHGPKGVGAIFIRKGVKLQNLLEGGPQENNKRAGTENIPGIVGFAKAAELGMKHFEDNRKRMCRLRDRLIKGLLKIEDTFLNGAQGKNLDKRLCNNVNITFKYIEGEAITLRLSMEGICVSTGSACSSKDLQASPVLTAMGLKHEDAHGSIRFSLSHLNTENEIDYVIEKTKKVVKDLRAITAFVPKKHSHKKLMKRGGKNL